MAYKNILLFSHCCGGQKSEISFTGPALQPPGAVGEALFLASLVAVDTPWLVATSPQSPPLWPHHLFVFCMQYTTLCLSLMRMHVMALKAHLANPGWPHLKICHIIISAETLSPNKVISTKSKNWHIEVPVEPRQEHCGTQGAGGGMRALGRDSR